MNLPLRIGSVWALPSTFLYLRVTGGAVQAIAATDGVAHLVCDRPRFLFRDLQAGRVTEFDAGMRFGQEPFEYNIESATLSTRRETTTPGQSVLPENVPPPKDSVVLETATRADYHHYDSLQIIGITKHQRLIVGFSATSYQLTFSDSADLGQFYRSAVKADLLNGHAAHFTTLPHEAFLNWCPSKRIFCAEISEIQHRPDSWGALQVLTDLRADPSHAAFRTRITRSAPAKGMDL